MWGCTCSPSCLLKVLVFVSVHVAGKFSVTVLVVRILLTWNWLRYLCPSDGRQTQALQKCHLVCSRVLHGERLWQTHGFSTTICSDLKPGHNDCRILLLCDNISTVLCFTRGRSRDFRLCLHVSSEMSRSLKSKQTQQQNNNHQQQPDATPHNLPTDHNMANSAPATHFNASKHLSISRVGTCTLSRGTRASQVYLDSCIERASRQTTKGPRSMITVFVIEKRNREMRCEREERNKWENETR